MMTAAGMGTSPPHLELIYSKRTPRCCRVVALDSDQGGYSRSERQSSTQGPSPSPVENTSMNFNTTPQTTVSPAQDGTPVANFPEAKTAQVNADHNTMTEFMKPKFARAPIKEAGRVAYLGRLSSRRSRGFKD